jgi:ASPM-SPD-2-Hydin domain-containing protein
MNMKLLATIALLLLGLLHPAAAFGQSTYTWNGSIDSTWATPGNWSPARSSPASGDILIFDGTQATQPKFISNETVSRISVTGNTTLTIANGSGTVALTATAGSPRSLDIDAGVELIIRATGSAGNGRLIIGTTGGRIFGTVTILGLAQVLCTDASAPLLFDNSSIFNASQTAGSPFGGSPVADAIQFKAKSTFNHNSGLNPFTLAAPNTAVIFDPASFYIFNFTSGTSATFNSDGRKYGTVVFDGAPGFTYNQGGGSKEWTVAGNMTINPNITLAGGTVTVQPQIAGSIVNNGTWTPSTAVPVLLNGTAFQSIGGDSSISFAGGLTVNNPSGVSLGQSISVSSVLTFTAGNLVLGDNNLTLNGTVSGAGPGSSIVTDGAGGAVRTIPGGGSFQFPVSPTAIDYNPLTITLPASDPTETFTVSAATGVTPSDSIGTRAVQRTWTIFEATRGGNNATLAFQWAGSQEGIDFARPGAAAWRKKTVFNWEKVSPGTTTGADPYTMTTTTPITAFGFLTVASDVPVSSISPKSLSFGNVKVGLSRADSVTVRNPGTSTLNISSVASNDPAFTVTPASDSIAPSDSQRFFITFTPSASGTRNGLIFFSNNTVAGSDTVLVSGTGIQALFAVTPTSLSFGAQLTSRSAVDSVRVTNAGTDSLFITSIASSDTEFSVEPASITLDTGAARNVRITYRPVTHGNKTALIIFQHNGAKTLDTVTVTGSGTVTGVSDRNVLPRRFALLQNYPNPFNPSTRIDFELPVRGDVSLVIYDLLGKKVAELASGARDAGAYSVEWNAAGELAPAGSGIYFARLNITDGLGRIQYTRAEKMLLLK